MTDGQEFFGIGPNEIPAFVHRNGDFVPMVELPGMATAVHAMIHRTFRDAYASDAVAFEVAVRFVAAAIGAEVVD